MNVALVESAYVWINWCPTRFLASRLSTPCVYKTLCSFKVLQLVFGSICPSIVFCPFALLALSHVWLRRSLRQSFLIDHSCSANCHLSVPKSWSGSGFVRLSMMFTSISTFRTSSFLSVTSSLICCYLASLCRIPDVYLGIHILNFELLVGDELLDCLRMVYQIPDEVFCTLRVTMHGWR